MNKPGYDDFERLAYSWRSFGGSSEQTPEQSFTYNWPTRSTPGAVQTTQLVDPQSEVQSASVALFTGSGNTLTSLGRYPESWGLADVLTRVNPQAHRESTFWRLPILAASIDEIGFEELFSALDQLSVEESNAFGDVIGSKDRVASDQDAGILHYRVSIAQNLSQEGLVQVTTENNEFLTRRILSADGLLKSYTDEAGYSTTYEYDALGRLVRIRLPDGTRHTQTFNVFGQKERVERSGIGAIEFRYYRESGLLRTQSHFGNDGLLYRTTDFDYDEIGRIKTRTHSLPSGKVQTFQYTYDGEHTTPATSGQLGFLSRVSSENWSQTTTHNPDGTPKHVVVEFGGWRRLEISYHYFTSGEPKLTEYKLFTSVGDDLLAFLSERLELDEWGRLQKIFYNEELFAELQYDDDGVLHSGKLPDGGAIAFNYHSPTQALTGYRITTRSISGGFYWAKNARNLVDWEEIAAGEHVSRKEYTYYPRGFLRSVTEGVETEAYRFDEIGLPTFVKDLTGVRSIERNSDNWTAGDLTYTLDALGRVAVRDEVKLHYGADGQVAQVVQQLGPNWSFKYDDAGNRVLWKEGDKAVKGVWSELAVIDDNILRPVRIGGVLIGYFDQDVFLPFLTDTRGTIVVEAEDVRRRSAFGMRDEVRPSIAFVTDFGNAPYDSAVGTYRVGLRDYDPFLGGWLSADPLLLQDLALCLSSPHEANLYGFARSNPINFVDPSGLQSEPIHMRDQDVASEGFADMGANLDLSLLGIGLGVRGYVRFNSSENLTEEFRSEASLKLGVAALTVRRRDVFEFGESRYYAAFDLGIPALQSKIGLGINVPAEFAPGRWRSQANLAYSSSINRVAAEILRALVTGYEVRGELGPFQGRRTDQTSSLQIQRKGTGTYIRVGEKTERQWMDRDPASPERVIDGVPVYLPRQRR